jgi:hypothetical protein
MARPQSISATALGRLAVVAVIAVVGTGCFGNPLPPPAAPPAVLDAACKGTLVASTPGSIAANSVAELSGIAASRKTVGVWWAHNDSGDSARVFAVGSDGRDLGEFALNGATATDWEDIAVGPGPNGGIDYLYVADTGDNLRARPSVHVYRVPEPTVDPSAGPPAPQALTGVATLTLTYPDAPHDAEAIVVDPVTHTLLVVTKESTGKSMVFRASADFVAGSSVALVLDRTLALGSGLNGLVTAADVTPAGDVLGLRTYGKVLLYRRTTGQSIAGALGNSPCAGATAAEAQGEAFGFTSDGRGYVTASEGAHPPLHRFVAP